MGKQLTVAELIETLKDHPQGAAVYYFTGKRSKRFYPVNFVMTERDSTEVAVSAAGPCYNRARTYLSSNEHE